MKLIYKYVESSQLSVVFHSRWYIKIWRRDNNSHGQCINNKLIWWQSKSVLIARVIGNISSCIRGLCSTLLNKIWVNIILAFRYLFERPFHMLWVPINFQLDISWSIFMHFFVNNNQPVITVTILLLF